MTTAVRVFSFSGIITAPRVGGESLTYDAIQFLKWPYLGSDLLSCDVGSADTSLASAAPAATKLAYVQVENAKRVHYELIPPGQDRTVTTSSPIMEGNNTLPFGPDWQISVVEAA